MVRRDKYSPLRSTRVQVLTTTLNVLVSHLQFSGKGTLMSFKFPSSILLSIEKEYRRCLSSFTKWRKEFIALKLRKHKKIENSQRPIKGDYENNNVYISGAYYMTWTSKLYLQSATIPYGFQYSSLQEKN